MVDEKYAVYIKDNLIVVEDDKDLVEKLNELLDGEEEEDMDCSKCEYAYWTDEEEDMFYISKGVILKDENGVVLTKSNDESDDDDSDDDE